MKLERPFYRLPVRFDVDRLQTEVDALPAAAWSRHPQEYEGNTAARLITVGGSQNDSVGGEMQPTPALLTSPYLQQVLASFGTVWSRSRLMRISGGGTVPQHSDVNYHWFYRVRVHVPIITRPEVHFFCGDQSVHMAAGEAWIFDNWRQHRVENPASDARIHLVADTTGTSAFWRLVAEAQAGNFQQPNQQARLVAYDPSARPKLLFERFNLAPVMPPAEVEQLAFDLLTDLAPANERSESAAAVGQFVTTIVDFCRDWRSLWSLFGDDPAARPHQERLIDFVRQQISKQPPVLVASAGVSAQFVLNARILEHLLGGPGGVRREAAEFNVAAAATRSPAAATADGPPAKAGFTGSLFEGVSSDAAGTVDTPGESGIFDAPREAPIIERPIIILSAPRAGSTLLYETLVQAAGLYTIGGESHELIESIDVLRPGAGTVVSNRLIEKDATPSVVAELRRRFTAGLRDRDGTPPPLGTRARLLEKTPKNALRVPFLLRMFPDARVVFLHRDPRANLSSMMEAWRSGGWVTYRRLPGWDGDWSLLLPPDYAKLRGRPLEEIVACQWQAANETILNDLERLPRERWTTVRYEDLVRDPRSEIARLLDFAGLDMDSRMVEYLSKPLPHSRYTQSPPDPDKWRRNAAEIERVLPSVVALAARLGR